MSSATKIIAVMFLLLVVCFMAYRGMATAPAEQLSDAGRVRFSSVRRERHYDVGTGDVLFDGLGAT